MNNKAIDYSSSVFCITGGTGSFGSTMVNYLISKNAGEIRIFSRDENKQDALRNQLKNSSCKFFIGDTRSRSSVDRVIKGSDYVFHAAALKQVPSCEFFPGEAVATNVLGSTNVIESVLQNSVKSIVCLSTDKAVYPINAMGMTKALMERIAQANARANQDSKTKISITRYGNVMLSRGSVIPLFVNQIRAGKKISLTDPGMTRFLMSLESSVDLVEYAFTNANNGDLFIRKAPACTVETLASAVWKLMNKKGDPDIEIIGTRHGEKLYESLLGTEEIARSSDEGDYFRVPLDTRSLDYEAFFEVGQSVKKDMESYTSHNTTRLNTTEVMTLLDKLPSFQKLMMGE